MKTENHSSSCLINSKNLWRSESFILKKDLQYLLHHWDYQCMLFAFRKSNMDVEVKKKAIKIPSHWWLLLFPRQCSWWLLTWKLLDLESIIYTICNKEILTFNGMKRWCLTLGINKICIRNTIIDRTSTSHVSCLLIIESKIDI